MRNATLACCLLFGLLGCPGGPPPVTCTYGGITYPVGSRFPDSGLQHLHLRRKRNGDVY